MADEIFPEKKRPMDALQDSEKRYRRLFESAKDGILILDADTGKVVDVNPFLLQLLGYSHEAMCGQHIWELGVFKDIAASKDAFKALQENEYIRYDDLPLETLAGKPIAVEFVSNVYLVDHSKVIQCNIRDITERKRLAQVLRILAIRNEAILAAVPDIIMEVDHCKRYTWANQAGLRFFGEDVVGREASCYFEGEQDIYNIVRPLFNGHEDIIYIENWQRRQDGEKRLLSWWCRVLKDEQGLVTGALSTARDITDRQQAEAELKEAKALTEAVVENIPLMIFLKEALDLRFVIFNRAGEELLGYDRKDLLGKDNLDLFPPEQAAHFMAKDREVLDGESDILDIPEEPILTAKKGQRLLHTRKVCIRGADGKTKYLLGISEDITERKKAENEQAQLEGQLQQAQKMESVGRLAGGVAHDFNNMLGVIIGHTEIALEQVDQSNPLHADLTEIRKAANRSADLTNQLLAFARKQTIAPKVLDMNETVEGMLKMLRRLIGEDINLAWLPGVSMWPVKVDPSQIDQILANLCVNARDAISGVGKITIETGIGTFDEDYCSLHAGFIPGEYVLLVVSDDGYGMDKNTLSHLYEPFFTTKETGKGTGLGLATVYGIVKQNNGFINVYSEPDQGTTFKICLPRHEGKTEQLRTRSLEKAASRGLETILLAEDEPSILELTSKLLKRQGYTVLAASTPGEAIRLAREYTGEIHLLMTDVVMPEMNGRDLAKNLLSLYPHLKRLFMSGYTADVIAHHGVLDEGVYFIQKPFSIKSLAVKVREALDSE